MSTFAIVKSDIERGPFGAWAFHTRDRLDLKVEEVADRLGYHPASLRKMESGSVEPSRRMVRELPTLYSEIATAKGVVIPQPPASDETRASESAAVLLAIEKQTAMLEKQWTATTALVGHLAELVQEIRGDRRDAHEERMQLAELIGIVGSLIPEGTPAEEPSARPARSVRNSGGR